MATSYDQFKEYQGRKYTGMKVGRRHRWKYDAGDWSEKKVTPDQWEFTYAVKKRRAGKAPEGSGAPVGTAYRWYILANQVVTKLDANSYMTEMVGLKYKLAHKRADKASWSSSEKAQRKQLVKLLHAMIEELEAAPEEAAASAPADGKQPRKRASADGNGHAVKKPRKRATAARPRVTRTRAAASTRRAALH